MSQGMPEFHPEYGTWTSRTTEEINGEWRMVIYFGDKAKAWWEKGQWMYSQIGRV